MLTSFRWAEAAAFSPPAMPLAERSIAPSWLIACCDCSSTDVMRFARCDFMRAIRCARSRSSSCTSRSLTAEPSEGRLSEWGTAGGGGSSRAADE